MERQAKELFQAQEFATLVGVTVLALHHYDRLGLLKPKQRSRAGYRLLFQRHAEKFQDDDLFETAQIAIAARALRLAKGAAQLWPAAGGCSRKSEPHGWQ